jgi:hypothetical protein
MYLALLEQGRPGIDRVHIADKHVYELAQFVE